MNNDQHWVIKVAPNKTEAVITCNGNLVSTLKGNIAIETIADPYSKNQHVLDTIEMTSEELDDEI